MRGGQVVRAAVGVLSAFDAAPEMSSAELVRLAAVAPATDKAQVDVVRMGGHTVGRFAFEPGWRWSECVMS